MLDLTETLKLFLKRTFLALALFTACRILFLLFNPGHFTGIGFDIFIYGIRFDLSAYFYWYLPFIIISLIGIWINTDFVKKAKEYTFYISSFLVALFNCIDIPYFRFTFKRSTSDLFTTISTGNDVITLMPKFLGDFWPVVLAFSGLLYGVRWSYRKMKIYRPPNNYKTNILGTKIITTISLTLALVIAGRGGFQLIPLSIIDASKKVSAQNVPLVLNTPFTILQTIDQTGLSEITEFESKEADHSFPVYKNYKSEIAINRKNIIVVVLESFSNEFLFPETGEPRLTPFLSSLLSKSLVYNHCFANGKKSIEGIPAILSSMPTLLTEPIITSNYAANHFESFASILKKQGYHSSFYHGGKNGTMNFDGYASAVGFDKYVGLNEYPNQDHYDGAWGIPDEPFLQFYADELSKTPQPFFSSVFTLSSHHPFIIPEEYRDRFTKGKTDLENSVSYTDYALQLFMAKLENNGLTKNTIFIFTSDHTSTSRKKYFRNSMGNFHIPFIIYSPGDTLVGLDTTITQQIDILPTVLDIIHYPDTFFAFGQSKWRTNQGFSIQMINEVDQFIEGDYLLQSRGIESMALFNIKNDSLLSKNLVRKEADITEKLLKRTRLFRQQYNNHIVHNDLLVK